MKVGFEPGQTAQSGRVRRGRAALALCTALAMLAPVMAPVMVGGGPALAQVSPRPGAPASGFADLAEKLLPAVVNISTTQVVRGGGPGGGGGGGEGQQSRRGQQNPQGPGPQGRGAPEVPQFPPGSPFEELFKDYLDRPRSVQSLGSGFIIDSTGYVVTNNHVIADADEIKVRLHDNTELTAKLVGRDKEVDIAVLKVESSKPLPSVKFGDSEKARVGDWVVAIGNPFGLGGTVTVGIVSARGREIGGRYDDYLQTDASINRGNSGGPMFNLAGEVIGINTAIYSPTGNSVGIGFAVPSAIAANAVAQLRQYGRMRRGWLGVKIQTVTDEFAESLGLDKAKGALIAGVTEQGPAEAGKVLSGDVVIRFDGREVAEMRMLPRIVAETPVDKLVDVVVWRKGREVSLKIKLGELPDDDQVAALTRDRPASPSPPQSPVATVDALGLSLSALTPELRKQFGLAERTKGVLIAKINDRSSAAERDLQPGDVIVEVAQEEVSDPAQVLKKINEAKAAGRKSVLVMVERKGEQRFVGLSVGG